MTTDITFRQSGPYTHELLFNGSPFFNLENRPLIIDESNQGFRVQFRAFTDPYAGRCFTTLDHAKVWAVALAGAALKEMSQ